MHRIDRGLLVASIILIFLWGLIVSSHVIITAYHETYFFTLRYEKLEIVYVAANQTSSQIFCKLCSTGNIRAILDEVRVNDTIVNTENPLPLTLETHLDYRTLVFSYDGSWQGSILITLYTRYGREYPRSVDLETASKNRIAGAYPSNDELLNAFLAQRLGDIAQTVFLSSSQIFLVGITIVVPLLIWRSQRKVDSYPTHWGGIIIALSFIFSILVSVVTIAFPNPYDLPTMIRVALPILVHYVAAPATIVGAALVFMVLKYLAEHYDDRRILSNATAGFICMILCLVAAAMSTAVAYELGTKFSSSERRVTSLAPIAPPLVMNVQGDLYLNHATVPVMYGFFSVITVVSLLFSTVFFSRSIILVSTKVNERKLKTVWPLLAMSSGMVAVFSTGISVLIPLWCGGIVSSQQEALRVVDLMFAASVLVGVGILSVAWIILSSIFSSIRAAEATRSSPTSTSNVVQE